MKQKLILPINDCQLNAGYKSERYRKEFGFSHYGIDLIERERQTRKVYACGDGTVTACGADGANAQQRLGNCIVIVYKNVQLSDGRTADIASRMFHFEGIDCKPGDRVKAGTPIGIYGNTGAHSTGPHLHIEFDTDIQYPSYAVGIAQSGNIIKRGSVDSTINPCSVFWLGQGQKISAPESWITEGWVDKKSLQLPQAEAVTDSQIERELQALKEDNNRMKQKMAEIQRLSKN